MCSLVSQPVGFFRVIILVPAGHVTITATLQRPLILISSKAAYLSHSADIGKK